MRRIIRWEVPVDDHEHELELNGAVLHVDCRDVKFVEIWTLDSQEPLETRTFRVFATGQEIPGGWVHVGTALSPGHAFGPRGALVWHLMEKQ